MTTDTRTPSAETSRSPDFNDIVGLVSQLVEPTTLKDEHGHEIPDWDGTIPELRLEPEAAGQVGLGRTVKATVIGNVNNGIAFVMRSRNLFKTRRYGFLIRPVDDVSGSKMFEFWQAPAMKPERHGTYIGPELIDRQQAQPGSPSTQESFIKSLRKMCE